MKSFHDHFSGVADRYADFRPRYPAKLFEFLATLVPRHALVWDCAAGNGQATVDLATRFDRVIATDASREQIASATPSPNVEYRVAPAEQSGLAASSVGLITVAQAVHWFDLPAFYAEVNRVLVPEGVLAVWTYGMNLVEGEEINGLIQEYYSKTVGPYWPPERKLVEEGYRTIPFPFAEMTPPAFHMEARWTRPQLMGYLGTWSATSRFLKAKGYNPLEPLEEKLKHGWPEAEAARLVTWPVALRVGRRRA